MNKDMYEVAKIIVIVALIIMAFIGIAKTILPVFFFSIVCLLVVYFCPPNQPSRYS